MSRFAAQKIQYFLKTGLVNVDGMHSLDMNQAPAGVHRREESDRQ